MKTKRAKVRLNGFTLVEILIVCAIIGILAAIAIPNFMRSRSDSQATVCINNLRQVDSAAQQFAIEAGKSAGTTLNFPTDLTPYIKLNAGSSIPTCPAGGNYVLAPVGSVPSVSCSLGNSVTPAHSF